MMKSNFNTLYAGIVFVGTLLLAGTGERKYAAIFLFASLFIATVYAIIYALRHGKIRMTDQFATSKIFSRDKYPRSYWFFIFVYCCVALVCLGSIYFQIVE